MVYSKKVVQLLLGSVELDDLLVVPVAEGPGLPLVVAAAAQVPGRGNSLRAAAGAATPFVDYVPRREARLAQIVAEVGVVDETPSALSSLGVAGIPRVLLVRICS